MSQRVVAFVVDRLLTDSELREQFAFDRFGTLAELYTLGFRLSASETDALLQSDLECWSRDQSSCPPRVH